MCGRYVLHDLTTLTTLYSVKDGVTITPNYNVAPTHMMPVITDDGIRFMRWGLIPKWAKDEKIGYRLINARSETIFDKPVWRSVITKHRCLIPANGFYEWHRDQDGRQPYYITVKDQDLFMFAGVWETWVHQNRERHTYSILTTVPNKEMSALHDRMPVILHAEDHAQWLAADHKEDITPLLTPYEHGALAMIKVSKDVNSVKINGSRLIQPLSNR